MTSVREATEQDAAAISECLTEAFEPYRSQYSADGFADTVLTPDSALRRMEQMTILVAVDEDGTVVGTVGYQGGADNEGHLHGMAVRHSSQGRGVAAQLLAAAETGLRKCGCRRVILDTTRPLTRAITFYERHGYKATGLIGDFFGMELVEYEKRL